MAAGQKPIMRVSAKRKQGDARVNLVAIWARDDGRGYSAKLDRGVRVTVEDENGEPVEIDPNDWWINFTDFRELDRARGGGGQQTRQPGREQQQTAFDSPPPDDDDIPF